VIVPKEPKEKLGRGDPNQKNLITLGKPERAEHGEMGRKSEARGHSLKGN